MTPQVETLKKLAAILDRAEVPYMVVGSHSSGHYGEARSTNDIDIIIAPTHVRMEYFLKSLGEDYYSECDNADEALEGPMFNVIDLETGVKTDLIPLKKRPYDLEAFKRRKLVTHMDVRVAMLSPEDAILSKLEWVKIGESERQFRDAFGVAATLWDSLDKEYLRKWARELKVEDLLDKIVSELQRLNS